MWFNDGAKWFAVVIEEEVETGIKVLLCSSIKNPHTKKGLHNNCMHDVFVCMISSYIYRLTAFTLFVSTQETRT